MRITEGEHSFDFKGELGVRSIDNASGHLKSVDFIVDYVDETWLIEITSEPSNKERPKPAPGRELYDQLKSGVLESDTLQKFYGSRAYMALKNIPTQSLVYNCLIIGLPPRLLTGAVRTNLRNRMKRITEAIGPVHHHSRRPTILVESIDSWNNSQPDKQISEAR